MKIHLLQEKTIREFIAKHTGSRISFEEWLSKIKSANWNFPGDIKSTFDTADLLARALTGLFLISRATDSGCGGVKV